MRRRGIDRFHQSGNVPDGLSTVMRHQGHGQGIESVSHDLPLQALPIIRQLGLRSGVGAQRNWGVKFDFEFNLHTLTNALKLLSI